MAWKIINSGKKKASENMAYDAFLLDQLAKEKDPILHLYEWQNDAATYGYFIDPSKFLNISKVNELDLDLAKRPTGGGIVFHSCDVAFSILVPATHPSFSLNPLENYAFVNERVRQAIHQFTSIDSSLLEKEEKPLDVFCESFCMAKPTKYDVMIGGKKVGGAAQRKTKWGYLHQGSILLCHLEKSLLEALLGHKSSVIEGMQKNSFPLLPGVSSQKELLDAKMTLTNLLQKVFKEL